MSNFSSTYPSVSPSYQIDFSNGKRIPPNATFSRADTASSGSWSAFSNTPTLSNSTPGTTNQYYLISVGSTADLGAGVQSWTAGKYIQWNGTVWAQVDQPIGVTYWSNEKHLSNENLLLQSEDFTTTWSTSEAGGSGGATAPDGGTDAYTITCYTASSKSPRVNQSLSGKLSTNTQYTMVGHVKAGTATHGFISFRGTNSNNYAYAQIEFASPGSVSTGGAGFSGISGTVTALGSSWYRLTLTATTGSDVSGAFAFLGVNDGTAFGISGYPIWNTAGETLEIWGAQLSSTNTKVYDSPTTTQIARSYAPSLKYVTPATGGMARFEYDPTDGQSMGVLIESQATNLVTYSSDITQSFFTGFRSTQESNVAVGPDGTLTADLFREDSTAGNSHGVYFEYATGGTTAQTISVYAKAAGRNHLSFRFDTTNGVFGGELVYFNLSTGAVGTTDSNITASMDSCGNGWYRCIATRTALASGNGRIVLYLADADNSVTFDGNSYSGVLLWGIQAEANSSHASSLVSTSGATATRAADSLSVATADIGYTGGDVTVVGEASFLSSTYSSSPQLFDFNDNTSSNKFAIYRSSGTNGLFSSLTASGTFFGTTTALGTAVADTNYKFAATLSSSRQASCVNGGTVGEDTSVVLPEVTTLDIGNDYNGGAELDGHIKRIAIYSETLSDTNLQAITS